MVDRDIPDSILITGGAGFIGSFVVRALAAGGGPSITVLDDLSGGEETRLDGVQGVRLMKGSILDGDALEAAFSDRPDVVVHMAASFANRRSVEEPLHDLDTNAGGTLRVLEHARKAGSRRFVYASSSCVYGAGPGPHDEEESPLMPYTPYAASKLAGEHMVSFFHRHHGMPTVALRYFNCYGPGERADRYRGVVARFVGAALAGEPLVVTGTGQETRQLTYVQDAARATVLAVRRAEGLAGGIYNVASGVDTRVIDLARAIIEMTGGRSTICMQEARPWDVVRHRPARTDRAKHDLGFTATTGLAEGLVATVEHARRSPT